MSANKIRVAIFASGTGTNAKKIIEHFSGNNDIAIALIVCNKSNAGVLNIAANNNIPTLIIEREEFFRGNAYLETFADYHIIFIVLAGFIWKIPEKLIKAFPGNIINIHPALLPKYGGKGMYGSFVHEAVIAAKEKESGITIHFVDELYDHGDHILQVTCPVYPTDTAATLAARIHNLEHAHFPSAVESVILKKRNTGEL